MALIDNLVSYWKFDESSGNATDSVASNTLTNNGTTAYAAAKINNGADLDGSNDYFSRSAQTWGVANAWSWSFWIKPDSFTVNPRVVFFGPNGGANNVTILLLAASSKMALNVYNSSGTLFKNYTADTTALTTGAWYHIVITWDGTNLLGYINNTSQTFTKTTDNAGTMTDSSRTLYLGATSAGTAPTNGLLDEVGLWSRAITSSEVTELYNGGLGIQYPFSSPTNTTNFFAMM